MVDYAIANPSPLSALLRRSLEELAREALGEAAATLREAAQLAPGNADVLAALARVHLRACDLDAHDEAINAAIARAPRRADLRLRAALACPPIMASRQQVQRVRERALAGLERLYQHRAGLRIDDPLNEIPTLTYYFAYHGQDDAELHRRVGALLRDIAPSLTYAAPRAVRRPGPMRIGFLSTHLRDHTIGQLFSGLIARLDPARFQRVIVFVEPHVDKAAVALAEKVEEVALVPRRLDLARRQIAGLGLDALLYLDIGMDPFTSWLAYARLASLQATTWGHPVTSGIDTIDAFFSLSDLEPSGGGSYTETLFCQDAPNFWYEAPRLGARPDRRELGLPQGRLYGCPQSPFKLHPDFDEVLVDILARDPHGTIVLHAGKTPAWRQALVRRLEERAPGCTARIHWLGNQPRERYIQTLAALDVMLDPFPFGGGNTTLEAFGVATPVVTMPPALARGRLAYAFYRQMGWTECVVKDPTEYAKLCVRIAREPALRERFAQEIWARSGRVFARMDGVRQFEDSLERAYETVVG